MGDVRLSINLAEEKVCPMAKHTQLIMPNKSGTETEGHREASLWCFQEACENNVDDA